jgi:NADP-dependent 3-hydroxy acid dehydrogenase YdfG
MSTIFITGCSSGFGLETAHYFLDQDWTVIASMRSPREDLLPASERLHIVALDVTDDESIARAVSAAGPIDVLVNNAGVGVLNALEAVSIASTRELFETNTIGTIAMTKAVVPQFRERKSGVIVNVSSAVTLMPLPLLSVYTATKAAVNAFTESLAFELEAFNVRVRLVLPGRAPDTRFGENAQPHMGGGFPEPYAGLAQQIFAGMQQSSEVTLARDVAEAVWQAANDPASPMRIPAGADAKTVVESVQK